MGMSQMSVQQPGQNAQPGGKGQGVLSSAPTGNAPIKPQSVEDLYGMYSDRAPDQEGLNYWKQQFGNNIDENAINSFKQSAQGVWNQEGKPADYSSSVWNKPQGQPITQIGGKGGSTTNAATSGQPRMAQPNMYPNTVGKWDNASIQPTQSQSSGGKGKGS